MATKTDKSDDKDPEETGMSKANPAVPEDLLELHLELEPTGIDPEAFRKAYK